MTKDEKISMLLGVLCAGKGPDKQDKKRIEEKTDEQLDYILSPIDQCIYLEACAGSGKTEVLGLKAAYEICKWESNQSGIAVLTFTNEAADTIAERISSFYSKPIPSKHFVGTLSSFVHGHIAQRFGYKFYDSPRKKNDKSFRIVDSDIRSYKAQWLTNYKLDFPLLKQPVYANQLSYKIGSQEWHLGQGESSKNLEEIYNSPECQQRIEELRTKIKKPSAFSFNYLLTQAAKCKKKFLDDGFATFEDMNIVAIKCLKDETICGNLAKKFPVILIDECQDLSAAELKILSFLIRAGVSVHYIGDLHQAIYAFKDSYPEKLQEHITEHSFKTMHLSKNFRSAQKIVDVSVKLSGIDHAIVGRAEGKFEGANCGYLEYEDEKNAVSIFIDILEAQAIPIKNAAVLVRAQSTRQKLLDGQSQDYKAHPIINAIQLWQKSDLTARQTALKLLAWQLQKWIGFCGKSNNYYYSEEICASSVIWRLLLRDILIDFCSDPAMLNMENLAYRLWYSNNRSKIVDTVNLHLQGIGRCLPDIKIKSPKGTANSTIERISIAEESRVRIETIHSAKGDTFDAVLLLSTPNAHGKTGYWQSWLNPLEESGRIAYVASTRPRYLLCWGVNKLSAEQQQKLEEIGLYKIS